MELKVWVEGIQRIVCGVSEVTTCQDVVYALAHATGKTGRFTLIERWRNSERLLAPHEHPLKILLKWGEHASDVQLILQRSALETKKDKSNLSIQSRSSSAIPGAPHRFSEKSPPVPTSNTSIQQKDLKKSLTFSGAHSAINLPTENMLSNEGAVSKPPTRDQRSKSPYHDSSPVRNNRGPNAKQINSFNHNNHKEDINENTINNGEQHMVIKSSPIRSKDSSRGKENSMVKDIIKELVKDVQKSENSNFDQKTEKVVVDGYYKELVNLVNQQREKLSSQQIDLTKFEAEIAFSEARHKDEESRLNYIKEEIQRLENLPQENGIDAKTPLELLENQLKDAQMSETRTEEEIASIKLKLADSDHKIDQMKAQIKMLSEAIALEKVSQEKAKELFKEEEQEAIVREIEKLQVAVVQATNQAEHAQHMSQQLGQEMSESEFLLGEKRKEIEILRQAMKEANMEALAMTPPDDAKALAESRIGNGTSRRMKGSPRQLETAVPTSKNPHGVWV